MPYANMPKEKWPAMERCVQDVLNKHKGEEGFGKDNAIAICHQSIMGGLALEPITADELTQYGNHALFANVEPGALLRFKNAHLCSAGENLNKDSVDEDGIKELATTIAFRAIDDEHNPVKVIGFFVNPRAEDNSTKLVTDGIIYADRFPEIVAQVQSGIKKLSVEAGAQKAVCSVCGGEFVASRDYCEHLKGKTAVRKLYGLKAKGGATVFNPAWDTSFDANGFVMIASQTDFGQPKTDEERAKTHFKISDEDWDKLSDKEKQGYVSKLPPVGTKRANEAEASLWERIEAKLDTYLQRFKPVLLENDQIKGGVTMGDVKVDELNLVELGLVQASELETLKTDLEAKLADKDTEIQKLKTGFARVQEMNLQADQLEILADMSEDAYQLLKSQQKPKVEVPVQASVEPVVPVQGVVLEGNVTPPIVPLTWETVPQVLKLKKEV